MPKRAKRSSREATTETIADAGAADVVTSSLTDDNGNTLEMEFYNTVGTAIFVFAQDTILLKQDTTASGIQYSNENYVYIEHHGAATLTKDGKVLFEKRN